ncbi:MAG: hypothetical protein Q3M24_00170 [Candidatus Electrothrix aestuarii]|uniref:Uncharacterized protein n=1 Tax=Candidatus Electrothrix aestuarii TaxID=3062594 RepID=A0AAU8LWK1_9BACT
MFNKSKVLFFVIMICSISFVLSAFAAAPKPAPASYKQVTFNAEKLSQEVAQVTGLALNPIFCMSALGAYYYFSAPEQDRAALPWHLSPVFWGPLSVVLGLIFLKDTFGVAFPKLLKSPLDAFEILVEKNTSAVIALPVLVTSVTQGQFQQLQQLTQLGYDSLFSVAVPVALAAGSADVAVNSGLDMLLMTLTSLTASMIFIVVWVLSQAFNVLILLCPFSLGDAILSAAKNSLVVLIIGLSGNSAGLFLSLAVIAFAVYLFPKTLRLVVFGTVMSHDLVFYKLLRSRSGSLPKDGVSCFSSCYFGRIPPMTFGRLAQQDGALQFSYRSCLFFGKKIVKTGVESSSCEVFRGIISPIIVLEEEGGEQVQLFRIRPKFYRNTEQVAELLGVRWSDEAVIVKCFSGAVRWYLGLLRKTPRLDVPGASV